MSRYTGIPCKPWQSRPGGGTHPLAGGGTQPLTAGVSGASGFPLSQAAGFSMSQPEASSRAAFSNRPAASIHVPRFAPQPQPRQALPPPPPAHAMRSSQAPPAASQPPATFAPWSQRSHMDNIVLGGIEVGADQFEERTVGDNTQMSQMEAAGPPAARALVVGSSPQQHQQRPGVASQRHQGASDAFGKTGAAALGSQEVHGRFETANAAAKLLDDIARKQAGVPLQAFGLEDNAAVGKLSTKLDAVEGRQGALEAAVGNLQTEMAAQGVALQGVNQACDQLLQALQFITSDIKGFSGSMEERLHTLLAKQLQPLPPPRITGDMATQTSPLAAPERVPGLRLLSAATAAATQTSPLAAPELAPGRLVSVPPAAAAAAQVPSSILRAFNQCRPSSACTSQQLLLQKPTVLPPASAPRRGLFSTSAPAATDAAAPPASGCPLPTKPTTSSPSAKAAPAPAPVRRSTRLTESQAAADGLLTQKEQPLSGAAMKAAGAAAPSAKRRLSGSGSKGPSNQTKRRTPAQPAAAAAAPLNDSQPRSAAAPAGPSAATSPAPHLAAPAVHNLKVAPRLGSFGRKRSLPAGLGPTAGVPPGAQQQQEQEQDQQPASKRQQTVSKQDQQQQPAGKSQQEQRARRASKQPQPARKPLTAALSQQPSQQPSKLRQAASQAEVLFDSLFGDGGEEVEPASLVPAAPSSRTDRDLAAAVQRQLARHQQRVAKSRQHRPTLLSSEG